MKKYGGLVDEYIVLLSEQAFRDVFSIGIRLSAEAVGGAESLLQL